MMKTIHAVYENGIFRPTEAVELPEGTPVLVEASDAPTDAINAARARVYEILDETYAGGDPTESQRHDEHQP